MLRISTICAASGLLVVLAFSANTASAGSTVTVHTALPNVKVQTSQTIGSQTSGSGSGKATLKEFQINKTVDKSSAVLYDKKGSSGGDRPTESTSLNFTKQQIQYTNQTSGGLKTDRASPVLFDKQ